MTESLVNSNFLLEVLMKKKIEKSEPTAQIFEIEMAVIFLAGEPAGIKMVFPSPEVGEVFLKFFNPILPE